MAAGSGLLGKIGVELNLDTARFTSDLGKVDKQTRDWVGNITSNFTKVQGAIAGIGATLGVIGFANKINEVAKFRAGLDDLADAGLGTVESLSRVKNSVRAFGGDFDDVAVRLGKMVSGLAGSDKETSKAGDALERLGIKARTAAGALRAPSEVFEELSVSLAKYRDNADKTAVVQAILGKGAEKYLPLLKDMAELGIKASTVTAQQAQEADNYEKAIRRLGIAFDGSGKIIAGEFIVPVTAAAQVLADLITKSNGFRDSVKSLAGDGSITTWVEEFGSGLYEIGRVVTVLGGNVKFVFTAIGREIGGIAAQLVALAAGDWNAFTAIGDEMKASAAQARKDFDEWEKRVMNSNAFKTQLSVNKAIAGAYDDQVSRRFGVADKPTLDSSGLGTLDKKAKEVSEYAKAIEDANKRVATSYAETLDPLNNLTSAEKKLVELRASDVWVQFSTQERITLRVTLEQAAANEKVAATQKEWNATLAEATKLGDEFRKKQNDEIKSISDKAAAINEEIANYGKLPSAIAAATLAIDEQVLANARLNGASEETIIHLTNVVKSQRNLVDAFKNKEGFEAMQAGFARMGEIVNSVGDAIANIAVAFTKGWKSGIDAARNYLKQLLADLVAMMAKKWFLNIIAGGSATFGSTAASAASSALGGMGNSLMGTGLSAAGNWLAGTSAAASLFGSAATTGAVGTAGLGSGVVGVGGMSAAVTSGTAGSIGSGGLGASMSSYAAAAAPYMAALAAVMVTMDRYKKWGNDTTGKVGVLGGAAAGAYAGSFAGPIGMAIGAALGAIFGAKAFGRGAIDTRASGISGAISGSNFAGQNWKDLHQAGGWFRNDKNWTETAPMGSEQLAGFDTVVKSFQIVLRNIGGMLGKDSDKLLEGFTASFKINLKDRKPEDIQKDIDDFFDKMFRDQLGVVLKDGSDDLMKYVEGFKGSTVELIDFAAALAGISMAMPDLAKTMGLSFAELEKFALVGENIVQTFARVVNEFNAARASLDQAIGARNPVYARMTTLTARNDIAQAFADAVGLNFGNELLERMALNPESFTGLSTATMTLLANFLNMQTTLEGLDTQLGTFGASVTDLNNVVLNAGEILGQGSGYIPPDQNGGLRSSIAEYLNRSLLSGVSPLDPMQRYNEARAQYETQFSLARGGDTDALAGIAGYRDAFLEASRAIYASSGQYNSDYFGSFNQLAGLTAGAVRPYSAADGIENTQAVIAEQAITTQAIAALANVVIEIAQTGDPILRAKAQEQVDVLNRIANRGGSLVSSGF